MKNLKVLLVNAPVVEVFEPWFDLPDFGRVGLAYIAGYLRKYADFHVEIKIIDAKFERLNFEETIEKINEFCPDIVGFTAFTNEIKPCGYIAHKIKENRPHVITVIGGAHVTAIPTETLLEFPGFDLGVVGEGEQTFLEICSESLLDRKYEKIKGLVFKNQYGKVFLTDPRPRILDQDLIPFPAWDLLPPANTYFVQSTRGCPFNCVFCMNHNGRVARSRSIQNVIEELELIIETFKPKRISFGDELFSVDMKRTADLMDAMIKAKIGERVSWDIQTHVNFVDEELFTKMKKANVAIVEMGVETGDETLLKLMGKATNAEMIVKAFNAAKRKGIKTGSFLLFGQPGETLTTMKKTVDLAVKINADLPMFGLMTPYPGTEVAKLAAEGKGGYKLVSLNWDNYRKQIGSALEFADISRRQIEFYQMWGYVKVFLWNFRFIDFLSFLLKFRMGAWSVFKKVILNISDTAIKNQKPVDYDEVTGKGQQFQINQFIKSREEWKKYQKDDVARMNREKHGYSLENK